MPSASHAAVTDLFDDAPIDAKWIRGNCCYDNCPATWDESSGALKVTTYVDTGGEHPNDEDIPYAAQADVLDGDFDIRTHFSVDAAFGAGYEQVVQLLAAEDYAHVGHALIGSDYPCWPFGEFLAVEFTRNGSASTVDVFFNNGDEIESKGTVISLGNVTSIALRLVLSGGDYTAFYLLDGGTSWIGLPMPSSLPTVTLTDVEIKTISVPDDDTPSSVISFDWFVLNSEMPGYPLMTVSDWFTGEELAPKWVSDDFGSGSAIGVGGGALSFDLPASGASYPYVAQVDGVGDTFDIRLHVTATNTTTGSSLMFLIAEDYSDVGAGGINESVAVEVTGGGKIRRRDVVSGVVDVGTDNEDFAGITDLYLRVTGTSGGEFAVYVKALPGDDWAELRAPTTTFTTADEKLDVVIFGTQAAAGGEVISFGWIILNSESPGWPLVPIAPSGSPGGYPWAGVSPWGR